MQELTCITLWKAGRQLTKMVKRVRISRPDSNLVCDKSILYLLLRMLSICIPIFHYEPVQLVNVLLLQCQKLGIPFEINCFDDASDVVYQKKNQEAFSLLPNVRYKEMNTNLGRAGIRNELAKSATYQYLLYLDADVSIPNNDFIEKYLLCIQAHHPVCVGGIQYSKEIIPREKKLHHTYGSKRESISANIRAKNPYSSFLTGNLLIQKKHVIDIQFSSSIVEYGHEDTLFCIELKNAGIRIHHLENPIIHEGLETNQVFIQKQLTAVNTLSKLIFAGKPMQDISLYQAYLRLERWKLLPIFSAVLFLTKKILRKGLENGVVQWLFLFDVLRLEELNRCLNKSNKLK